nr:integrase arm-type DNA-binding domain-containing protein [Herbaspirillum sp. ASV7]
MFDVLAVQSLSPGKHLTIPRHRGLRLRVGETMYNWIYRYKNPLDGRIRQVKLGEWPGMSLAAAIGRWEQLKHLRDQGADPSATQHELGLPCNTQSSAGMTVQQIGLRYYEGHVRHRWSERGAREVLRIFERTLGEFATRAAQDVDAQQACDFLAGFLDRPIQGSITRRELGAAWAYAIRHGLLPAGTVNIWREVMRAAFKSRGVCVKGVYRGPVKRVLSVDELVVLLPWLPQFTRANEDILSLMAWTCAPCKDICDMHADQFSQEGDGWWWTPPQKAARPSRRETSSMHRIALSGRALAIVQRRLKESCSGFLFEGRKGGRFDPKNVGVAVWNAREDCQSRPHYQRARMPISDWSPNDLRRSSAALLEAIGCPREMVDLIQGKLSQRAGLTLDTPARDLARRLWLERLGDVLESLMAGRIPAMLLPPQAA